MSKTQINYKLEISSNHTNSLKLKLVVTNHWSWIWLSHVAKSGFFIPLVSPDWLRSDEWRKLHEKTSEFLVWQCESENRIWCLFHQTGLACLLSEIEWNPNFNLTSYSTTPIVDKKLVALHVSDPYWINGEAPHKIPLQNR